MRHKWILSCAAMLAVFSYPSAFPQSQIPGFAHAYLFLCDTPGFCVKEVHPKVVRFRVECKDPGFETVIWEGLPRVGDFIDTLGANKVEVQAFYSFAPGEHQLVGFGVIVETAEWPGGSQELRATCTIRQKNPNWDFSLLGRSFCIGGQSAAASGYRVQPGSAAASRAGQSAGPSSGSGHGTPPSDPNEAGDDLFDKYFGKSETAPAAASKESPSRGANTAPRPSASDATAAKPQSDNDSLLGVHWPSGDDRQQGTAAPAPQAAPSWAPRTESEVRQGIENMGFRIAGPATFGSLQGYWIEIADHARAAQFGFKEIKKARAVNGREVITGTIACWTERSGDHLVIWIDQRDVSIPNDSKLPSYVRLFSR
jgi:hypothetical protein